MSTFTYSPIGNGRQRTNKAWRNINVEDLAANPNKGFYWHFNPLSSGWSNLTSDGGNGKFTLVQATAGQLVINDAIEGGEMQVDCNTVNDNQGASAFAVGCIVTPSASRLIVAKFVVRARDIASGLQAFMGFVLSTLDTTPVTADAPASGATDYIGLYTTGNTGTAGRVYFAAEDGGTQSLEADHVHTFLDGDSVTDGTEVVKFEIRVNGTQSLELYIDGEEVDHAVAASAIPEGTPLRLALACLSSTTADPILGVLDIEVASVPLP
jgi:hypothetical protein